MPPWPAVRWPDKPRPLLPRPPDADAPGELRSAGSELPTAAVRCCHCHHSWDQRGVRCSNSVPLLPLPPLLGPAGSEVLQLCPAAASTTTPGTSGERGAPTLSRCCHCHHSWDQRGVRCSNSVPLLPLPPLLGPAGSEVLQLCPAAATAIHSWDQRGVRCSNSVPLLPPPPLLGPAGSEVLQLCPTAATTTTPGTSGE